MAASTAPILKNYIFGLLFLKRANDVFEEEVEIIINRDGVKRKVAEDETYFKRNKAGCNRI